MQRIGRLNPSKSILLLCDIQEKFAKTIQYFNEIADTSIRVLDICKLLNVPYVVTEQYPQGLGKTIPRLQEKIEKAHVFDKTRFSMCTQGVLEHMNKISPQYNSVVLCGIEAHACILSTCLDLIEAGKDVHVIVDAVSSRSLVDRKYAFERMKQSGAFLTTSESIIFQFCKDSKQPNFKDVQKIIRTPALDSGLLNF